VSDRFEDVFRTRYGEVYGLAWRVLGDRGEAEDAAQDAFAKLAGSAVLDRPDGEVAAWLRRVTINDCFNRVRGRRRARERVDRTARLEPLAEADGSGPLLAVLRSEEQAEVRAALAGLPERQRATLLLRHSGYRYAENAQTLDIAIGSVGVLLARAERAFRTAYEETTA
jgi:RNA polymerase sigma-70 factor (ECF subfamily)